MFIVCPRLPPHPKQKKRCTTFYDCSVRAYQWGRADLPESELLARLDKWSGNVGDLYNKENSG